MTAFDSKLYFGTIDFGAGASGATTYSDYLIDLTGGNAGKDWLGNTEAENLELGKLTLWFKVTETAAGGTSTIFKLISGSTLSGSNIKVASAVELATTGSVAAANTVKGDAFAIALPIVNENAVGRYIQLISVATGDYSAGIVEGGLVWGLDSKTAKKFDVA